MNKLNQKRADQKQSDQKAVDSEDNPVQQGTADSDNQNATEQKPEPAEEKQEFNPDDLVIPEENPENNPDNNTGPENTAQENITEKNPSQQTGESTDPQAEENPFQPEKSEVDLLAESLEEFAPFLENATFNDGTLQPKEELPEVAQDDDSLEKPAPFIADIPARLQDSYPEIKFQNAPLLPFLEFVTQLSTIPIVVDPVTLQMLNVSPTAAVSVQLQNATLEEILTEALRPWNLNFRQQGDVILIINDPPVAEWKTHLIQVEDLRSQGLSETELLQACTSLADPLVWQSAGGPAKISLVENSLQVTASERTLFQVKLVCEKLRSARSLNLQTSFPQHLTAAEAPRKPQVLQSSVRLNYLHPVLLTQVIDRMEEESNLTLLIDWHALQAEGWNIRSEVTLEADGVTLESALTELTQRMGLTWLVISPEMLMITSDSVAQRTHQLGVYQLSDPEQLIEVKALFDAADFPPKGSAGLYYDKISERLLTLLNHEQHESLQALLQDTE